MCHPDGCCVSDSREGHNTSAVFDKSTLAPQTHTIHSNIFISFFISFLWTATFTQSFIIPHSIPTRLLSSLPLHLFFFFSIYSSFHSCLFPFSLPLAVKPSEFLHIEPFCCGGKKKKRVHSEPDKMGVSRSLNWLACSSIIWLHGKLGCFQLRVLHDNENKIISFRPDCASWEIAVIGLLWLKNWE